jgi:putative ABC transport system substrate-binding protein
MKSRRKLIIAAGVVALATPLGICAQSQGKVWRIGVLASGGQESAGHLYDAFTQGLRDLGYVEGRNIVIERRFAEGRADRLPALAAELVQAKVDVIFAPNTVAVQAAKQVAGEIPIVFASVDDPVGSDFVVSLAKPGRNITGLSSIQNELSAKRLQLLKDAFPKISRVAVFISPHESISAVQLAEVQRAAQVLGLAIFSVELRGREDFAHALASVRKGRADSMYALESGVNFYNRKLLVELAAQARLPAVYPTKDYMESGGLMSYGTKSGEALFRRAATYVDKILKGARPGELPVEQPTEFVLSVNKKTAKTLGLKVPNSILLQATNIIE